MYTSIGRTPKIQIQVLDNYFNEVGFIDRFKFLQIRKEVNKPGYYQLVLYDDDEIGDKIGLDHILRFHRFDGKNQYIEYEAFHRTRVNSIFSTGTKQYSSFGRGLLDLMNRRIVAWRAGTPNRSEWDQIPVLRVMSDILSFNLVDSATIANGRLAEGNFESVHTNINYINSGTGLDRGELWSGEWSYRNVLQAMKSLSEWSKANPKPSTEYPNGWWEIKGFYSDWSSGDVKHIDLYAIDGGIGKDKTATINFAPSLDNVKDLWLSYTRSEEITRVYGLGAGQQDQRQIAIAEAADKIYDSRWNVGEASIAAPQDAQGYALTHAANIELLKNRREWSATFTPYLHGPWRLGDPDDYNFYNLGDTVKVTYQGIEIDMRITAIDIMIGENGKENIKLQFENINQLLPASSYIVNPDDTIEVATVDMIVALQNELAVLEERLKTVSSF